MTAEPSRDANAHLAHHRYVTIKHTIPDRLDLIADQLGDCLEMVSRYGLAEALQPDPATYQGLARGLRDAAGRIRAAAQHIPSGERGSGGHIDPDPGLSYGGLT
jgi:hypothetical protein